MTHQLIEGKRHAEEYQLDHCGGRSSGAVGRRDTGRRPERARRWRIVIARELFIAGRFVDAWRLVDARLFLAARSVQSARSIESARYQRLAYLSWQLEFIRRLDVERVIFRWPLGTPLVLLVIVIVQWRPLRHPRLWIDGHDAAQRLNRVTGINRIDWSDWIGAAALRF